METLRAPGVYLQEIPVFPPSVAEVETAIPAFIGYTQTAVKDGATITMKPTKIYSMKEYEQYFGFPEADTIKVTVKADPVTAGIFTVKKVEPPKPQYLLYYSMKMFFDNGGGQCYVVSVGPYVNPAKVQLGGSAGSVGLMDGLNAIKAEDEPTLIVIPEAIRLAEVDYAALVAAVLLQCETLQDRFGVFDLYGGDAMLDNTKLTAVRAHFGTKSLKYGAAYYPFLRTGIRHYVPEAETNVKVIKDPGTTEVNLITLQASETSLYNTVKSALNELPDNFVVLPPSGPVTGLYAFTDRSRGVWKAPANLSVTNVVEPMVKLDNTKQGDLNIDPTAGVSINALRSFAGKGTLVWGARTLAGNDNEWRYVPVRRFFNMVEESVKKSTYWAVFEPNDANTWVKVRGMIESYLTQKWREGALAGATTKEAFFVRCSLGTTMNAQDILEGRMFVEIGMAVVRPAEFIVLKFFHKLQTS